MGCATSVFVKRGQHSGHNRFDSHQTGRFSKATHTDEETHWLIEPHKALNKFLQRYIVFGNMYNTCSNCLFSVSAL